MDTKSSQAEYQPTPYRHCYLLLAKCTFPAFFLASLHYVELNMLC